MALDPTQESLQGHSAYQCLRPFETLCCIVSVSPDNVLTCYLHLCTFELMPTCLLVTVIPESCQALARRWSSHCDGTRSRLSLFAPPMLRAAWANILDPPTCAKPNAGSRAAMLHHPPASNVPAHCSALCPANLATGLSVSIIRTNRIFHRLIITSY